MSQLGDGPEDGQVGEDAGESEFTAGPDDSQSDDSQSDDSQPRAPDDPKHQRLPPSYFVPGWRWHGPGGGAEVLRLALPLAISMLSLAVMLFTDRMFLLWHGAENMAAAVSGGMVYFTLQCLPFGITSYANSFVSQYFGAGQPQRIVRSVVQAGYLGILVAPLFVLGWPLFCQFFSLAGHTPEAVALESEYLFYLCWAVGPRLVGAALSAFFTGQGRTSTVMVVDSGAALLNVGLDYLLIFGTFGFPEWGLAGAGIATAIAEWIKAGVYLLLMLRAVWPEPRYDDPAMFSWDSRLMGRLLYFGGPNGLQMFVECAAFAAFILVLGGLGERALVVTSITFGVNNISFIPLMGVGTAVSTLVARYLGQNRDDIAARATYTATWMAGGYSLIAGIAYLLVPDLFLIGHAAGVPEEQFTEIRNVVVVLLRFVVFYCIFDAIQLMAVNALKGAGDTRFIFVVCLFFGPIPVVTTWAGIHYFGWSVWECWLIVTLWIGCLALMYGGRFAQGSWRKLRVIEELGPSAGANDQSQAGGDPQLLATPGSVAGESVASQDVAQVPVSLEDATAVSSGSELNP